MQYACGERDRLAGRLRQTGLCATYDAAAARETWHSCETDADRVEKPAASCIIADPTPTPLNVRTMPYGAVIQTIENGSHVHIIDERADQSGNRRVYVADSKPLGWVYKKHVLCKALRSHQVERFDPVISLSSREHLQDKGSPAFRDRSPRPSISRDRASREPEHR